MTMVRPRIVPMTSSTTRQPDELYWLKLYHLTAKLNIEEILYRKKRESIELESELDAELVSDSYRIC